MALFDEISLEGFEETMVIPLDIVSVNLEESILTEEINNLQEVINVSTEELNRFNVLHNGFDYSKPTLESMIMLQNETDNIRTTLGISTVTVVTLENFNNIAMEASGKNENFLQKAWKKLKEFWHKLINLLIKKLNFTTLKDKRATRIFRQATSDKTYDEHGVELFLEMIRKIIPGYVISRGIKEIDIGIVVDYANAGYGKDLEIMYDIMEELHDKFSISGKSNEVRDFVVMGLFDKLQAFDKPKDIDVIDTVFDSEEKRLNEQVTGVNLSVGKTLHVLMIHPDKQKGLKVKVTKQLIGKEGIEKIRINTKNRDIYSVVKAFDNLHYGDLISIIQKIVKLQSQIGTADGKKMDAIEMGLYDVYGKFAMALGTAVNDLIDVREGISKLVI